MRTSIALLMLMALSACEVGDSSAQAESVNLRESKPVELEMITGFFVKNDAPMERVDATKLLIRNKERFDEFFAPEQREEGEVTLPDFSVHQVGALILPADMYDQQIEVMGTSEEGDSWTVLYQMVDGPVQAVEEPTAIIFKVPLQIRHLEFIQVDQDAI